MEPLALDRIAAQALVLVDTAPIIYVLENHPRLASRFAPLFAAHEAGRVRFAVTTITIAEVLTGAVQGANEPLVRRYRATLESWQVVPLDADIAEAAARLRAGFRLKLADAVQAASALTINADALVTHDRDFSRLTGLRVFH